MKKINTPKVTAFIVILGFLGSVLFAFQNFTPHISQQPSDVSDLYMNSALSTALKTKERGEDDRKLASSREISWEDNSSKKIEHQEQLSEDEQDAPDMQE